MKILKIILATVGVAMSSYGLITGTIGIIVPYVLLAMGGMLLVTGVKEFQKRKPNAFTSLIAAGFIIFVAVYTL
ncbi:DUF3953 domain-containing protein [Halobacillus rhizosphaerae]|uniref:DUF3953 domain-containing protein n=1 Tax=Halobacillus rhizosphaerae TaxID=3064889 RepID=UPI00398AC3C3